MPPMHIRIPGSIYGAKTTLKTSRRTVPYSKLPRLNPRKIKFLLVREEYKTAYEVITWPANQGKRSIFLVTGQPGIGI